MDSRLENVFKTTLGIDAVPADLSQRNCETWDSVNHLNLVLALESEFGVTFEPEEIASMRTLSVVEKILSGKI